MGAATGTEDWATAVQLMTENPATYARTSRRAFAHAKTSLTWDSWARGLKDICQQARMRATIAA